MTNMKLDGSDANIVANVTFISPKLGGRRNPITPENGYRGQFFYNETDCDAMHVFDVEGVVPFGLPINDYIFLANPIHIERVSVGMPILIREGPNTVAYGQITQINVPVEPPKMLRRRTSAKPPDTVPHIVNAQEEGDEHANDDEEMTEDESAASKTIVHAYWQNWNTDDENR